MRLPLARGPPDPLLSQPYSISRRARPFIAYSPARSPLRVLDKAHLRSQYTKTHKPNSRCVKGKPRTRHRCRFILMLATWNACRAHRHGSESPFPGSTSFHSQWLQFTVSTSQVHKHVRTHSHSSRTHLVLIVHTRFIR